MQIRNDVGPLPFSADATASPSGSSMRDAQRWLRLVASAVMCTGIRRVEVTKTRLCQTIAWAARSIPSLPGWRWKTTSSYISLLGAKGSWKSYLAKPMEMPVSDDELVRLQDRGCQTASEPSVRFVDLLMSHRKACRRRRMCTCTASDAGSDTSMADSRA